MTRETPETRIIGALYAYPSDATIHWLPQDPAVSSITACGIDVDAPKSRDWWFVDARLATCQACLEAAAAR